MRWFIAGFAWLLVCAVCSATSRVTFASHARTIRTAGAHAKHDTSTQVVRSCPSVPLNIVISRQRELAAQDIISALAHLLDMPVQSISLAASRVEHDLTAMLANDGWLRYSDGYIENQIRKWLPSHLSRKERGGRAAKEFKPSASTSFAHSWNVLELQLQTCQPRETQLHVGSLIRSGDLLAAVETVLMRSTPLDAMSVSTVMVMMRIDHLEDIIRQNLQQASNRLGRRTISSLIFEQTSPRLFDVLRKIVALAAIASIAVGAIIYLIIDMCPVCNDEDEVEQFITSSRPVLSDCCSYKTLAGGPGALSAADMATETGSGNLSTFRTRTRAKLVQLLRLGGLSNSGP